MKQSQTINVNNNMKTLLLFSLFFIMSYFLVHSITDDWGLSFSEAFTTLAIGGLTFLTYVAFKIKPKKS